MSDPDKPHESSRPPTETPHVTRTTEARHVETLREVALDSLRWAQERKSSFELPENVTESHIDLNWTMKPLGELAQLSSAICQHSDFGEPQRTIARELLEFSWRETRAGNLLLDLFQTEPNTTYPLEIYAAFAGAGLRNPRFEEFARVVARTRSWSVAEQDPTRRLGLRNAERRSGVPPHAEVPTLLRRTWLGGLPEPWTFERGVGYDLTHTVFHLTDWGNAPRLMPGDIAAYLHHWLPAWLDTCLDGQQWDLSCELLAVGASLPTPLPPHRYGPAWRRIAEARGSDGSLREEGTVSADMDEAATFVCCYHSTLAAAFAAVLTLDRTPAARPEQEPPRHVTEHHHTNQRRPDAQTGANPATEPRPQTTPQAGAPR